MDGLDNQKTLEVKELFNTKGTFLEIYNPATDQKLEEVPLPVVLQVGAWADNAILKRIAKIAVPDGTDTYAYAIIRNGKEEVFFVNARGKDHHVTGHAELHVEAQHLADEQQTRTVPHVNDTQTYGQGQKREATYRLWAVWQYVRTYYPDEALYSDKRFDDERAKRIWQRLSSAGVAVQIHPGAGLGPVFKTIKTNV